MLREEFEKLTGFYPTSNLYTCIENAYVNFNGDKIEFCKAYKENRNGLAEKIRDKVNTDNYQSGMIKKQTMSKLYQEIDQLKKKLEKEQEWTVYESFNNVKQADYAKLAKGAETGRCSHYMTDEEAIEWICNEFDFDPGKITILHDIDEYEINRHKQLRETGRKIDRRPVYCATDYYYIRFNTTRWSYEAWNGILLKF